MKILSFFGILASIGLFGLAAMLSMQGCYAWDCDCNLSIANKDVYMMTTIFIAIFFTIFSVVFFFKISELKNIQKLDISDRVLDSNLVEHNYTIYQLPLVQLLTKVGFALSILLMLFAYFTTKISCAAVTTDCNVTACGTNFSYDAEIYMVGYGSISIFFLIFTLVGLLKSYPSKY